MIRTARQLKDLIRNLSKEKSADAHINFYLSLPGVFQGVLENLFKDKFQPFFIGQYLRVNGS